MAKPPKGGAPNPKWKKIPALFTSAGIWDCGQYLLGLLLPVLLQLLAIFFTLVTLNAWAAAPAPVELAPELALEALPELGAVALELGEIVPLSRTSCPTCFSRSDVLP